MLPLKMADTGGVTMMPNTATESDSTNSGLMKLPPEIRLNIYELCFIDLEDEQAEVLDDKSWRGYCHEVRRLFTFGLVHTSQVVRCEVMPLFIANLGELSAELLDIFRACAETHERLMYSSEEGTASSARAYEQRAAACLEGIQKVSSMLQDLNEHDADGEMTLGLESSLAEMKRCREYLEIERW